MASSHDKMLLGRLAGVGNFIKPMQDIVFHGAQPEAQAFEKSEKSWRDHNYCKWHWPGAAWLISWSPICILWRTVHSRPWNHIDNLEIIYKKRNYNDCHIMPSGIVALKGTNLAMEYGELTMSEATT
jgi:hypothetical protein